MQGSPAVRASAWWIIGVAAALTACEPEVTPTTGACPEGGLVPAGCESSVGAGRASGSSGLDQTGFIVLTALDRTGDNQRPFRLSRARQAISDSKILESMAEQLNEILDIRQPVFVMLQGCGAADAHYDPTSGRILICDEFLYGVESSLAHLPPEQFTETVLYVVGFTFLHEVGHALFDKLQLRITGREEDVADQFAAYMLASTPEAKQIALAGAEWFRATFLEHPDQLPFSWDTHSLDPQRFFNINCWVLGSDPDRYAYMILDGTVPAERAVFCPGEFAQFALTFSELLAPYVRP